jgi:ComF family protein
MKLRQYINDFTHLVFPFNCFGCNRALDEEGLPICAECIEHFPLTEYWNQKGNEVEKVFWGRLPLEAACSYFFFEKKGLAQHFMHQLKYKGKTDVGLWLGRLFGKELQNTGFSSADVVVPVPLHHKKRKKRGYNQCDYIATGLAESLGLAYEVNSIERLRSNDTQTRKGRYERWINVQELFQVTIPESIQNKHVLLVDDVVTTGATLEACAGALLQVPSTKVSIATIACPSPF